MVTSPWGHSPCWSLLPAPALNVIFPLNCSARTDALAISYLARLEWSQSVQFSSVAQSCPTVCDPMNRSTPGLPLHHQLPEFTETHVHRVSDAIQPSHRLSSSSPPAPNPSQQQSFPMSQLFAWGGQSTGVSALASVLPKKSQGYSPSEWTGWISLQSKGLSRIFSNTTVQKHQRSIFSFLKKLHTVFS